MKWVNYQKMVIIQRHTEYLSVFSPNADQKMWTRKTLNFLFLSAQLYNLSVMTTKIIMIIVIKHGV